MNPFVLRITHNVWLIPVSAMMAVMGFLLTLAWVTTDVRTSRIESADPDLAARLKAGAIDLLEYQKLSAEVQKLRAENTQFQNAIAEKSDQGRLLNESLQEAKLLAGVTEVEGPGITIKLRDSEKVADAPTEAGIIHDVDVLRVVNELWAAGAEAIAVNGHRVVSSTSFRCVGPVILVDRVPIASPVVIQAIGDPAALEGAMKLPGGVVSEIRGAGDDMVTITNEKSMRLPAYSGSTSYTHMTVPKGKP